MRSVLITLVLVASMKAQIVQIQGGDSSLMNAAGGGVSVSFPNKDSFLFGGGLLNNRFVLGANSVVNLSNTLKLTGGDTLLPTALPTDFSPSTIQARGLNVQFTDANQSLSLFAGEATYQQSSVFFPGAHPTSGFALLNYERKLGDRVKVFSFESSAGKLTAIQSLSYDFIPRKLVGSIAGGVGENKRFSAARLTGRSLWGEFDISETQAAKDFHRTYTPIGLVYENTGLNARGSAHWKWLSVYGSQSNVSIPTQNGYEDARTSSAGTAFSTSLCSFTSGIYHTNGLTSESYAAAFHVAGFTFRTALYHTQQNLLTAGLSRRIGHHYRIDAGMNHSGNQYSMNFGGGYSGNRVSVSLSHAVVYLPQFSQQFEQVASASLSFRITHQAEVSATVVALPDHSLRWTGNGDDYLYAPDRARNRDAVRGKYIFRGTVKDDTGKPIEGMPVQIGKLVVYSDINGDFFVRDKRASTKTLSVLVADFNDLCDWAVVSAPLEVTTDSEATIVVRRK